PEKLSRIPSNTSTVTTNPETLESTYDNEINESELRRRIINIEATDRISITPDIINTTVEPDFVVEQNGPFHENLIAAIHLSSSPAWISRIPYIIMVIYSHIFEELLAVADVQEAYLFCKGHFEIIKDYIKKSKWSRSYSPIKIITNVTPEARSVEDAMRKLDAKQLINSDFILIYFDVVSNIHLDKVLDAHRARKSVDNNAIMTMLKKQVHFTGQGESPIFVLDRKTNECVHCETVELYLRKRRMVMDIEVFKKHADVQIRNDLIDCQVDICSVERLNHGSIGHHLGAQLAVDQWVPTVGANPNIGIYYCSLVTTPNHGQDLKVAHRLMSWQGYKHVLRTIKF
ncbi:17658_t:CDS:10, partial [Cetraspora pellucida]